jgi:hypothetical protein
MKLAYAFVAICVNGESHVEDSRFPWAVFSTPFPATGISGGAAERSVYTLPYGLVFNTHSLESWEARPQNVQSPGKSPAEVR